jgi:hypothetical protein
LNGFEVVKDLRVVTKLLVSLEWSAWEWVRHAEPWRCVHMSLRTACCTILRRPYFASHMRSVSQVCVCVCVCVLLRAKTWIALLQKVGLSVQRSPHPSNTPKQHTQATHPSNTPKQHTQATHPSNTPKHGLTHLHPLTPQNPYLQYAELIVQDNRCFLFVPLCACSFVCGLCLTPSRIA